MKMHCLRSPFSTACFLVAAGLLTACSPLPLRYAAARRAATARPTSVGVYWFEDARPGWPRNAPSRTVSILTAELPITYNAHVEGDREIGTFVSEALRAELAAGGANVRRDAEFDRAVAMTQPPGPMRAPADRLVLGRINYFGSVQPGFAGLLFQSSMPTGKVFLDLDLRVVDPSSGAVLWAGTVRRKHDSRDSWTKPPADMAALVITNLRIAMGLLLSQKDFWEALDAAPAAALVSAP